MERIDYNILNNSLYYYELNGFKYLEVDWIVNEEISNITKPPHKKNFYVNDKVLVASSEQSFMQMIHDSKLDPGKYVTLTPCFRDEIVDKLHKQHFMKTELFVYDTIKNLKTEFINVLHLCCDFYKKYTTVIIQHNVTLTNFESSDFGLIEEFIKNANEQHVMKDIENIYNFDIIDKKTLIELGSYGIRTSLINNINVAWIYATGVAEPRLSSIIHDSKLPGYHNALIPKNSVGSFDKILEEFEELKDAKMCGNKIMELVEISDLIGAIELYVKKEYNINLNDLDIMNKTTQRAFLNGRR